MIKILDCTLRDGGYNNNWEFGKKNIVKIFSSLVDSKIDIVECGFLTQKNIYTPEKSLFDSIDRMTDLFSTIRKDSKYVCMINYGEYDIDNIPNHKENSIDGIRVAFHKKDMVPAMQYCEQIAKKGYKTFIQPMVTVSYTDEEFINLIKITNEINPYAFYIVDSFGVMKKDDLMRFFYLVDHNLNKAISIGFHSHNNLQLSYSNAQALVDIHTLREIIIDSSVMGMGRGAGNLNTELFIQYLNDKLGKNYFSNYLLKIIDEILTPIYHHNYWGYSLSHYLSALHNCHPNYSTFLDNKNTLNISDINKILSLIPDERKVNYEKNYIEDLYIKYQTEKELTINSISLLKEIVAGKEVLVVAPGNSIIEEEMKINEFILHKNLLIISVNFIPTNIKTNYTFISNLKRYDQIIDKEKFNLILTSNISNATKNAFIVNYIELLNNNKAVEDNAGLMLIKLLIELNVSKIYLAGFDGYSQNVYDNYSQKDLAFIKDENTMRYKNEGLSEIINQFKEVSEIEFITRQKYILTK